MTADQTSRVAAIAIAVVIVCGALISARNVFAPLALAIFVIALVWPLHSRLETALPKLVALLISMSVILLAFTTFGWIIVWAVSRVARAIASDLSGFQALYERISGWLNEHGIVIGTLWSEHFSVGWLLRGLQNLGSRLNSITSFSVVALVYVLLGLIEMAAMRAKVARMKNTTASSIILEGGRITSQKIGKYVFVRTLMSLITGALVFGLTYAIGLPLAKEWGVIAFVLNYIPFLGPLMATLLPTLYTAVEFQSWQATLAVFAGLNVIQFVIGSYMEPRVSGNALSISPFLVLFSIFFWTYMWGLFGAFIGVPITIALLTFFSLGENTRWIPDLLGGEKSD